MSTSTSVRPLPLIPEIRLHLADEVYDLWKRTQDIRNLGDLPMPFWAFAWCGGQALARYVLDHPELVRERHVVDVGSGSGLVAMAAALVGAASVVAVEIDPFAQAAIGLNAAENEVEVRVENNMKAVSLTGDDVVLAGDVFYEKEVAEDVRPFLQDAVATGATVLVGDPGRKHLPLAVFRRVASYEVPVMSAVEDGPTKFTGVWLMTSS